jgi:hypothetical protein
MTQGHEALFVDGVRQHTRRGMDRKDGNGNYYSTDRIVDHERRKERKEITAGRSMN